MTDHILTPAEVEVIRDSWIGRTIWPGSDGQMILLLCDTIEALRGECEALAKLTAEAHAANCLLQRDLDEARGIVGEIQWEASSHPEDSRCPVCYGEKPWDGCDPQEGSGHKPDCRLAAWLAKVKNQPPNLTAGEFNRSE